MNRWWIVPVLLLMFSCGVNEEDTQPEIDWDKERSTSLNKTLAMEEEIQIKLFLEQQKDWKMSKTGSGLQYWIYQEGNGEMAQAGKKAQVELSITMLDGKECYKTEKDEYEEFQIDRAQIESGIHEGIKLMHVGDKAKLIIPSHLAHGLVGDFNKIPPLTVIVVDIHLIGLV